MKITYTTTNGRLVFESDVSTPKEAFEWLAGIQELFEEPGCGLCGGAHVQHDVREFDGNNYYKLVCRDCGGTLDFGQRRDGSNLFIKRKDADGVTIPNRGWYRYSPAENAKPMAAPSPARKGTPARAPRDDRRRQSAAYEPAGELRGETVPF